MRGCGSTLDHRERWSAGSIITRCSGTSRLSVVNEWIEISFLLIYIVGFLSLLAICFCLLGALYTGRRKNLCMMWRGWKLIPCFMISRSCCRYIPDIFILILPAWEMNWIPVLLYSPDIDTDGSRFFPTRETMKLYGLLYAWLDPWW